MFKRLLILPLLCLASMVEAKTNNIPTYVSFVRWVQGNDTVYNEGHNVMLESASPDGTVTIRIRHEEWDNVVTENRQRLLEGWHGTMSAFTGIKGIIQPGKCNTDAMMLMEKDMETTQNAMAVDLLSRKTDELDMNLNTQYMIENSSQREIVINDLNRGLVWYVPAKSYLLFDVGKLPYACLLRIANTDPLQPSIKYVIIGSASFTMKYTVAYEDNDCWIYTVGQEVTVKADDNGLQSLLRLKDTGLKTVFIHLDKNTFMETTMNEKEVFDIINRANKSKKKKAQ